MKVFFKRTFLFLALPLTIGLLIVGSYLYFDPFKVVRKYNDYSNSVVNLNRDHVSTQNYLRLRKKYQYNSFLLGSSRTRGFRSDHWKQYLPPGAVPFVFDASLENIYGIYSKVKFLDSTGAQMDNVLLVICHNTTFTHNGDFDHFQYVKDPDITGTDKWKYQFMYFKTYLDYRFFTAYFGEKIQGFQPWMKDKLNEYPMCFDPVSNDQFCPEQERQLAATPDQYYKAHQNVFYQRHGETIDSVLRITPQYLGMLEEIKSVFEKHHTSYKVVISPLYEQVKFQPKDLALLQEVFGRDRLYDFSGANYFTNDLHHYYEDSHYRPFIGDSILKIVYLP